ncbi:PREDICTED: syntaxin-5-like [Rhagoletis zephyria]|uniref:syntaxin-5-like n=1 Tax=Rhagoletis zephyria TaxID=28612 RepID=UPI0008117B59|nr:PREDICTED: syntaxin-5-like [Rhagoletis zephyria]
MPKKGIYDGHKYIGKNIASAYAKLEKLTMLAKKKSLLDDRPQEIHELTYIMVYALQSKLASMGTDFKQILEARIENLKQQKARRDQFGQSPIAASTVRSSTAKQGSLLITNMFVTRQDLNKFRGAVLKLWVFKYINIYPIHIHTYKSH